MKRIATAALFAGLAVVLAEPVRAAFTLDVSSATNANATISTSFSLGVIARNISDNSVASGGVSFGVISGTTNLVAPQYLEVSYASNEANWGVNVWTNYGGTNPGAADDMGGLHRNFTEDNSKVSMGWYGVDSSTNTYGALPATGGLANGWTYIKSKQDSGWTAQQNVYARVISGAGPVGGNIGGFGDVTSPAVIYLSGLFAGGTNPPAGSYSATLGCDLYHE